MSKLSQLIAELCPNGVEYIVLEKLLKYEQPTQYIVTSENYDHSYKTPVLTAGQSFILGYTDESNGIYQASKSKPVIIFDDFTTSFHWVDFDFKVKSSAMKILTPTDGNLTIFRYLFYIMKSINYQPASHSRQWISKYSKFKIPIPPISIQQEIVRILDSFTELSTEISTEISTELIARKKQYQYYRDTLLTFDNNVPRVKLGEIAKYSKSRIPATKLNKNNYVGVDNLLADKLGKTKSDYVPLSGNYAGYGNGDILIGNIRPYLKKIWLSDRIGGASGDVLVVKIINAGVLNRYLFHTLSSDCFFHYNMQHAKGTKMPRGNKQAIMKYIIPLPPLAEQQRIVDILDRFDILANNISIGIPAEIEARDKQYQYYRNKLLSFKRLKEEL